MANWNFAKVFAEGSARGDEKGAIGGNNIKLVIAQSLKLLPWKEANAALKDPSKVTRKLYPSREDAFANISCTNLGELNPELQNRSGQHFANLRSATVAQLQTAQLKNLYQIELKNLANIEPGNMYDCFWSGKNTEPQPVDLNDSYLDSQDRLTRKYVFQNFYKYKNDGNGAPQDALTYAFKVGDNGVIFEEDPETPIINRHPIYLPPVGKEKLNLGHLTDIHVSSKQQAYKGRKATVIPGVDEAISPPIGAKANNNGDNFFDLLQQFGGDNDVDLLVITGDLYDHIHNFDPRSRTIETTGNLWEAMYVDSIKAVQQRADEFPYGIDGIVVYSLLIHYYNTYEKPLFITSGNHEAYEYPYGISPRIPKIGKFNAGIPLDHNLTIYEAILLYGPGYDKLIPFPKTSDGLAGFRLNFKSSNFDWFFSVFTPLVDYWQSFGDQCIVCLEWGDGEDYLISNLIRRGGDLPRATQSLNPSQRDLVETALEENKETVLCSHFTLVNYSLDKPLRETGEVGVEKFLLSPYDHGSGLKDRSSLYGRFLNHSQLKLSLAGHSHRAGLYACEQIKVKSSPSTYSALNTREMGSAPMVNPAQTVEYISHITTRGIHPEDANAKHIGNNANTKLLVSASAGPIPKQNLQGEMSGQGMEYPSGSKINADGTITLLKSTKEQAKPRFAVACDYIDILENGFWEHFKAVGSDGEFELKICWEKIHPEFPEDKRGEFIESVTLWLVGGGRTKQLESSLRMSGDDMIVAFPTTFSDQMKKDFTQDVFFLSLKFNANATQHLSGFKDYDYESPWNIQVGIYDKKGREVQDRPENHKPILDSPLGHWMNKKLNTPDKDPAKWQIMRHKEFGEVPYFDWRAEQWPTEFSYQIKKSRA
ncbi:MAG: metallophosphoesterase [Desulfuromonas sp.]